MIITQGCACDYLRLGSFDEEDFGSFYKAIGCDITQEPSERLMQYDGYRPKYNVFVGEADQGNKRHLLFQVSGADSDPFFRAFHRRAPRSSRVDFQLTLPKPEGFSARVLADKLEKSKSWVGRPPKIRLREDGGLDTVYVGVADSDRLTRIYVKPDDAGKHWLRYEVQFGRKLANAVWAEYCAFSGSPDEFMFDKLSAEFKRVPRLRMLSAFRDFLGDDGNRTRHPVPVKDVNRTLRWLFKTVGPAIVRLSNDHNTSHELRLWFSELSKEIFNNG